MKLLRRLAFIPIALAACSAGPTTPGDARAFLGKIVSYATSERTSVRSREFLSLLAPPLRAAVLKDIVGPDIGVLDYDPFCQCQDNGGITMRIVSLHQHGSTALAVIESSFGANERTRVQLRLLETSRGWRVADFVAGNRPSLLNELERNNRNLR